MINPFNRIGTKVIGFFKNSPTYSVSFLKKSVTIFKKSYLFMAALPTWVKSTAILSFALIFLFAGAFISLKTITINDENTVEVVYSFTRDPKTVLSRYGYQLSDHDEVTSLSNGKSETILIKRAFSVNVTADGKTTEIYTTGESVASVLQKAGVTLGEEDLINISLNEYLSDTAEVNIRRVTYTTEVLEESIPYSINQRSTPLIKRAGRVVVLTAGQNGTKETTVSRKLIDGEEVERTVISETVTKAPVTQVSLIGTPGTAASPKALPAGITIENGVPSSYKAVYEGRGTAYSASNHAWLTLGCVAVNTNIIPRGSILYVTSSDGSFVYGVAVASDTGSSLMSGHTLVDCFFPTYDESCWFGAKQMKVYVLQ